MMSTCHYLYDRGLPILLKDVSLLENIDWPLQTTPALLIQIRSFTQFILTNPKVRGPLVRKLRFGPPWSSKHSFRVLPDFARALVELDNLESLMIEGLERWLQLEPSLGSFLAALTKLKDVVFWRGDLYRDPEIRLPRILETLQSPTQLAEFYVSNGHRQPSNSPFYVLRNFTSTLKHMKVYNATPRDVSIVYPSLKTLIVIYPRGEMISVKDLLNSAPNLRSLLLTSAHGDQFDKAYERTREENIRAQRTMSTWSSLENIDGDVQSLYSLGLRICPLM